MADLKVAELQISDSVMSHRAQAAAVEGANNRIWDVLSNAWCPSTNPNGFVNVGIAENTLMHDQLLSFINTKLDLPATYLTYNEGGTGSSRLRRAIAQFLTRHLHPATPLDPNHLAVTNGVSAAIEHVSWAFADPGDGILLGKPYYGTFIADMSMRPGATVVPVNFKDSDPLSMEAVQKYEQALLDFQEKTGKKVKALMLCHPHNPLGRCYPREVIIGLMQLCQKYEIHLISDEIYALSVWENTIDQGPPPAKFESVLSIDLIGIIDPHLVHVLWGMSKDFGSNGLRLGVVISQANRDLHMALKAPSLYSYPSGPSDHLVSLILEDLHFTDEYIQQNRKKLSETYAYTVEYLKSHGIEHATGCNAAFFLWVNLGKKYRQLHGKEDQSGDVDEEVMQLLLQKRVFLASGVLFGSERPGWFRIVFAQPRAYLSEGLHRIVAALEERGSN